MTVKSLRGLCNPRTSPAPRGNLYIELLDEYETHELPMKNPKTTRRQIPSHTKNQIIGFLEGGKSVAEAHRAYDVSESTIRSIWNKYKITGSAENRQRSGRPPVLTAADKRHMFRTARKQRRTPFAEVGNQLGLQASESTIRRALKHEGYRCCVARKVPYLKKHHRIARVAWARLYRRLTRAQWWKVIWSDECYIWLDDNRTRIYVTRRADKEYLDECVVQVFKQSPVRVMIWGCIMEGRKGPLVVLEYPGGKGGGMNSKRYREQVLDAVLKPFYDEMNKARGRVHFQQDNASCHTSKLTKKWFEENHIRQFYHPANSPDLSPIEPVWNELKKIIRNLEHRPTSTDELIAAIHAAWEQLDIADVDKHILSMPDRVTAILEARGGHTRF